MLGQITNEDAGCLSLELTTGHTGLFEQAPYVVRLPILGGPLDLLLHLIEKRQMEITTISLMAVTDQYLAYLRQWQEMSGQPEQCGRGESSEPPERGESSGRAKQAGRPQGSSLHLSQGVGAI